MKQQTQYQLTIGWLYPELMSTYGDRGNITVLQKRCEWRGINVEIVEINQKITDKRIGTIDLLFGGGAQDREQELVMQHLKKQKKAILQLIENNIPALFVCGAPQLFGRYYEPSVGKRIEGLGIFDMTTKHPGSQAERLIGNISEQCHLNGTEIRIVGFENHGGRTHLEEDAKAFATVIKGCGNNGEDGTEGVVYKNAIGSYLHGPLLPKNPQVADYLIQKALEVKYNKPITLQLLDNTLEHKAQEAIFKRLQMTSW